MSRDAAPQTESHCSCGSRLRWEHRDGYGERRSVALCNSPDCGVITTALPEGVEPEQRLASSLLGHVPIRRYLKPWMRLYFKSSRLGFIWRPFHEVCPDCAGEMTVQLALPPHIERQADPYEILLCLTCGTTGLAWYIAGERSAIVLDPNEWSEPSTAVVILKRVLEERAAMAREGSTWDFQ
jgi:hypothetical protein